MDEKPVLAGVIVKDRTDTSRAQQSAQTANI